MTHPLEKPPTAATQITNPSFEQGLDGWNSAGVIETAGHAGGARLTHHAGKLETTQTLFGMESGWATLEAWVCSSGGQKNAAIGLKNYGGEARYTSVPIAPADQWLRIIVSAHVTQGQCTISLCSEAENDQWVSFDGLSLIPGRAALPIRGADISSLKKSEDMGGIYLNEQGTEEDALRILSEHGMNYARLRVWPNSPDGYHGKAQMLEMARRLKALQIRLLVDFHYSDSWADPGKQYKPQAWEQLAFTGLKQALYAHTLDICQALNEQGTPADMVQIGNEITNGMLWPEGKNEPSFNNLAALLKGGYRAVKESSPATQVMLHLDNGGNNTRYRWWFDQIIEQAVPFDLIGASYYPYWHGTLADLQANLDDIAKRYGRDIVVVETAYPFTAENNDYCENVITTQASPGYPFTPHGQARMLADVMAIVRAVPNGRGLGIMWWEATWTAVPGNGWDPAKPSCGNNWENQALFDYQDRPLPAMGLFSEA
jgi:arabinogalactan endo-1,4-beta-galactosidase